MYLLFSENVWMSTSAGSDSREPDMPDFSFSPQEYITQIGQYLMTLPQHLEPYMTNENPSLSRAFQVNKLKKRYYKKKMVHRITFFYMVKRPFLTFPADFSIPIFFSNLNYDCSN